MDGAYSSPHQLTNHLSLMSDFQVHVACVRQSELDRGGGAWCKPMPPPHAGSLGWVPASVRATWSLLCVLQGLMASASPSPHGSLCLAPLCPLCEGPAPPPREGLPTFPHDLSSQPPCGRAGPSRVLRSGLTAPPGGSGSTQNTTVGRMCPPPACLGLAPNLAYCPGSETPSIVHIETWGGDRRLCAQAEGRTAGTSPGFLRHLPGGLSLPWRCQGQRVHPRPDGQAGQQEVQADKKMWVLGRNVFLADMVGGLGRRKPHLG